jgi:hypothetical protein
MNVNADGAPRAVITGTGRSGTGYMSRLVTEAGTHVTCGHEGWFRELGDRIPGLDVDSSWLALPHIEARTWSGPVVHVVRHPVATVASLLRTEFFGMVVDAPYPQFALAHSLPARYALEDIGPVAAAVEFWADWNARCAAAANLTVRLEDVSDFEGGADSVGAATLDLVGHALGIEFGAWQVAEAIPRTVNTRGHPSGNNDLVVTVDEAYVWDRLGWRAAAFGYTRP